MKMVEIESFAGNDSSWHLIFDYLAFPRSMNLTPASIVQEAKWFEIDKLPAAGEFAHHGWGRSVLVKHALPIAQSALTR